MVIFRFISNAVQNLSISVTFHCFSSSQAQPPEDKGNLFRNNIYLTESLKHGVVNSAETLLCRLHPSHIAMHSYSGGKLFPSVRSMAPDDVNRVFKNRTIDTAALAVCSPYDCVDVTGKAYSIKDVCTHDGSARVAPSKCDSLPCTNDLSCLSLNKNGHVTNSATITKENYNIRLTLDRRKQPENYIENDTFNLHSCSKEDEIPEDSDSDKLDSNQTSITSYCKDLAGTDFTNDLNINFPNSGLSGYVDYNQYNIQSGIPPAVDYITTSASQRLVNNPKGPGNQLNGIQGTRPVSDVVRVPPHFYGSLSLLDDEGGEVTEL